MCQVPQLLPLKKQLHNEKFFFLFFLFNKTQQTQTLNIKFLSYLGLMKSWLCQDFVDPIGLTDIFFFQTSSLTSWYTIHIYLVPATLPGLVLKFFTCGAHPLMTNTLWGKGVVITTSKNGRCNMQLKFTSSQLTCFRQVLFQ